MLKRTHTHLSGAIGGAYRKSISARIPTQLADLSNCLYETHFKNIGSESNETSYDKTNENRPWRSPKRLRKGPRHQEAVPNHGDRRGTSHIRIDRQADAARLRW